MWETFASLFKEAKDRLNSPLYGVFILSFVVWNWDIFVTLLLTDNDSILILTNNYYVKAGYMREVLIWNHDAAVKWFGEYVNFGYLLFSCLRIFVPILLTYFFITQLPRLTNWAYVKDREFLNKRRLKNVESERDFEIERLKILKETANATEKTKKAVRQVERNVQIINQAVPKSNNQQLQQDEWQMEFDKLLSKYPNLIKQLEGLIYERSWETQDNWNNRHIPVEIEKILDASLLIKKTGTNRYALTEKGKHLLKMSALS